MFHIKWEVVQENKKNQKYFQLNKITIIYVIGPLSTIYHW